MIYILTGDYEEAIICATQNGLSGNQWRFASDIVKGSKGEIWRYGNYWINPFYHEINDLIINAKLPEVNKNQ